MKSEKERGKERGKGGKRKEERSIVRKREI